MSVGAEVIQSEGLDTSCSFSNLTALKTFVQIFSADSHYCSLILLSFFHKIKFSVEVPQLVQQLIVYQILSNENKIKY